MAPFANAMPWFLGWHATFWFFRLASPHFFVSFEDLDGASKSYWAASMVSSVHAVFVAFVAYEAATDAGTDALACFGLGCRPGQLRPPGAQPQHRRPFAALSRCVVMSSSLQNHPPARRPLNG